MEILVLLAFFLFCKVCPCYRDLLSIIMLNKFISFFKHILFSYLSILITFGILDYIWLGHIAGDFYTEAMQGFIKESVVVWPWFVFYLMYGFIIFVLAIVPNRDKPWYYSFIDGGLLGTAAYGTYNLPAYSLIDGFSLGLLLVDWPWGIFLTATSASVGWQVFILSLQQNNIPVSLDQ